MRSESGHIRVTTGVWAGGTALLAGLLAASGAPGWLWTAGVVWALAWLSAVLGLGDGPSRAFLAGTLRKLNFTQIYTALTRRNVTWLWARLCVPVPAHAGLGALLRGALAGRLGLAVAGLALGLAGAVALTGGGRAGAVLAAALFAALSGAATLALLKRGLSARVPLGWALAALAVGGGLARALVGVLGAMGAPEGWIGALVVLPLLPGAAQVAVSLLGVQGLWPLGLRRPVAAWVEAAPESPAAALRAGLGLAALWAVPVAAAAALGWALWGRVIAGV